VLSPGFYTDPRPVCRSHESTPGPDLEPSRDERLVTSGRTVSARVPNLSATLDAES